MYTLYYIGHIDVAFWQPPLYRIAEFVHQHGGQKSNAIVKPNAHTLLKAGLYTEQIEQPAL